MSDGIAYGEVSSTAYPTSWEKMLDVVDYLNDALDPHEVVDFAIKKIAPNKPSQHAENVVVARRMKVSVSTVENWRNGATRCSIPVRLASEAARTMSGPEEVLRELSRLTLHNHAAHFDWMVE